MLHFSWITDYLAIGPQPSTELRNLKKLGFRHVIDLNANPEEAAEASRTGIEYHPVEVRDTDSVVGWLAKLKVAVGIMKSASENHEPVYLHCTYGKGRCPTFAMAYLVSKGNAVQEATALVKGKHPDVWSPGNPTPKYVEILEAYSKAQSRSD